MENNELTDHTYDGIQEYDNPLPGWWKWMFIGTIVYSMIYALYFHVGAPGRSIPEKYEAAMSANLKLQFGDMEDLEPTAETLATYALREDKRALLRIGESTFKSNCVSCHGRYGEGKVGPNLADESFKNVRRIEDIARVINNGAGNGAMPAWSDRLSTNEVVLVSAYVASLRGTEPVANAKGPEGSAIDPWPEPPPAPAQEPAATNDKG